MKYKKIHLDQKASQLSNTKYNKIQLRSIIFKMQQKCKVQNKWQVHLGVTAVLLVTYIYLERGELGYSVNGINNKGVCMNDIRNLYQLKAHHILYKIQGQIK